MYVTVTKTGYTLYDVNGNGVIEECGKLKTGQIYLDQYNKQINQIHRFGVRLKDGVIDHGMFFQFPNSEGGIKEIWLPSLLSKDPFGIDHTEKDLWSINYIESAYTTINGEFTQVFRVEDIEELYFFDIHRINESGKKLKNCEDCDKLFIVNKNQVRCEECRKAGKGEDKKRENRNNNPFRKMKKELQDDLSHFHPGNNGYQKIYRKDFYAMMNKCSTEKELDILKQLHVRYKELDRHVIKHSDLIDDYLLEKWKKHKFDIWNENNPETWLQFWYDEFCLKW